MKSPFKFLDAFTLKDKDAFFGRDQEIDTLYSIVYKTPMVLVYGLSGTGKTSVIQCGLASRFDGPDWYPIFIRRNNNINTSTATVLRHALGTMAKDNLAENVSLLLRKTLRPVYLLFDQFEELFILGKEEEQKQFMDSIRELLDAQLPAKIILIMREEYIGQLYAYESLIPELFDHRFRVEPMGPNKVKSVISSSFDKFNIHLAEPKEELLDLMVHNISDPRTGITLPYLQVYLDMLYRDKYRKQYGQSDPEGYPKLDITKSDIAGIGRIDNVLERFLEDQTRELRVQLVQKYKIVKPNVIQNVLDVFVSEEGTKRPVAYKQSGEEIILAEEVSATLKDIPQAMLTEILNTLHQDRILRRGDENFELAHDSLALVVDGRRSQSQKQLQNIRKRLANAYEEFQKTGAFLNQKQLAAFDEFRPQLGLSDEMEKFLDKCEEEVTRQASEDRDRLQQESRMAQQKKLARTRGVWLTIAVALAVLAGFMAWKSNQEAKSAQISANEALEGKAITDTTLAKTEKMQRSLRSIIEQVDQQLVILEGMSVGQIKKEDLIKTVITLKSLVRKDSVNPSNMEDFISVQKIMTTDKIESDTASSKEVVTFEKTKVFVALLLNTPRKSEFIQFKWLTADGNVKGDPHYLEVTGASHPKWVTANRNIKEPGNYSLEVYNSQGIQIGQKDFNITAGAADEISMTENSKFFTMASGDLNSPGKETSTFKVGQMVHYWFRLNSPKAGEVVTVSLVEAEGKENIIWSDKFTTAVNTAKGFRGWRYHGARSPGKYKVLLMDGDGSVIEEREITIE